MVKRLGYVLFVAIVIVTTVEATTNSRLVADAGDQTNQPAKPASSGQVDAELEATATQLVASHLPELKPVLKLLRSDEPRQYDLAIRDLAKSARRLETVKKRDSKLYDIEVELLQAQSNAKLLTAKLQVRDSESDRKALRAAAARLQQAELSRVAYDVSSLQDRLKKTQQQLDAAKVRLTNKQDNLDEQLEKNFLNFLRKAGRQPKRNTDNQQ